MVNKIEIIFCFLFFHPFSSLINFKIVDYNKLKINKESKYYAIVDIDNKIEIDKEIAILF